MEKSTYEVLFPPLVSNVHDQAAVDQQNKMLKELGAARVEAKVLAADGHSELPQAAKPWAFKVAEVSAENAEALRQIAGPQFKDENAAAWAILKQRQEEKGALQERAAEKVGAPKENPASFSRADILENGTQVFVMVSERDAFQSMMKEAGFEKAHAYNGKTGETKVAHDLAEKAPELHQALLAKFNGEGRAEAWAAQPEVVAKADQAKGNAKDKAAVREYAATGASRYAVPEPLFVAQSRKAEVHVMGILKDIPSRALDARVAMAEEKYTVNAPLHQYSDVLVKLRGREPVKGKAEMLQEGHIVGAALGRKELERRGYEREFNGEIGKVPSEAQMKEIFGDAYKAPVRAASAERKAPAASPATKAGMAAAKPKSAGGRTARRPAAPAR